MMKDIKTAQTKWESRALALQAASDAAALRQHSGGGLPGMAAYLKHAEDMLDAWWKLGDELMLKHAMPAAPGVGAPDVSYPGWWLQAVGYPEGPPPVDSPDGGRAAVDGAAETGDRLPGCIRQCPEAAGTPRAFLERDAFTSTSASKADWCRHQPCKCCAVMETCFFVCFLKAYNKVRTLSVRSKSLSSSIRHECLATTASTLVGSGNLNTNSFGTITSSLHVLRT